MDAKRLTLCLLKLCTLKLQSRCYAKDETKESLVFEVTNVILVVTYQKKIPTPKLVMDLSYCVSFGRSVCEVQEIFLGLSVGGSLVLTSGCPVCCVTPKLMLPF